MIKIIVTSVEVINTHISKVDSYLSSLKERFNTFGKAVEEMFKKDTSRLDNEEKQSLESIEYIK